MNINRLFNLTILYGAIALAGSGCVATEFKPADAVNLHTIAIAPPDDPTAAADYDADLQNIHIGDEVKVALSGALRTDGYTVVDQGADAADAVLSIVISGAPPVARPEFEMEFFTYFPSYSVLITLRDAATRHVLYDRLFVYHKAFIKPIDGSMLIQPDDKYVFHAQDDIGKNPALAAEGVRAAIPIIAQTVGASLKKP